MPAVVADAADRARKPSVEHLAAVANATVDVRLDGLDGLHRNALAPERAAVVGSASSPRCVQM